MLIGVPVTPTTTIDPDEKGAKIHQAQNSMNQKIQGLKKS